MHQYEVAIAETHLPPHQLLEVYCLLQPLQKQRGAPLYVLHLAAVLDNVGEGYQHVLFHLPDYRHYRQIEHVLDHLPSSSHYLSAAELVHGS